MTSRLSRGALEARLSRWGAPATYITVVAAVGTLLVALLTRSPDTRANFQASAEGYQRTALASLAAASPYPGQRGQLSGDPATVFFGAGCAGCHGLRGEGGSVGPEIWTKNLKDVSGALRDGPKGMPVYAPEQLSDEQIAVLVNYLHDLKSRYPDVPGRKPARGGFQTGGATGGTPTASPTATAPKSP